MYTQGWRLAVTVFALVCDDGCRICACLCSARASAKGQLQACWGRWTCARGFDESVQAMSTCHPLTRRGALAAGISALAQLQILAAMRGEGVQMRSLGCEKSSLKIQSANHSPKLAQGRSILSSPQAVKPRLVCVLASSGEGRMCFIM